MINDIKNKISYPNVPLDSKIAIGLSGGVDSSVAAALLVDAGYTNVFGITLDLYGEAINNGLSCSDSKAVDDAKKVCDLLGIKHYAVDLSKFFMKDIIMNFVEDYEKGLTPNPCVRCNKNVKFGQMLEIAMSHGADYLITGHYAGMREGPDGSKELFMSSDIVRDQTYFLACIDKESIYNAFFMLSDVSKDDIRYLAQHYNLHVQDKVASNDLCFVKDGNYRGVIQNLGTKANQKGDIIDISTGEILASHNGIENFTVGQRKGLMIQSSDQKLYVIKIDRHSNAVYVGLEHDLQCTRVFIENINWLCNDKDISRLLNEDIKVKTRSTQPAVKANISSYKEDRAILTFEQDIKIPSVGQVCAIYLEDRLMGGGYVSL